MNRIRTKFTLAWAALSGLITIAVMLVCMGCSVDDNWHVQCFGLWMTWTAIITILVMGIVYLSV